jgi:hypothetical protein
VNPPRRFESSLNATDLIRSILLALAYPGKPRGARVFLRGQLFLFFCMLNVTMQKYRRATRGVCSGSGRVRRLLETAHEATPRSVLSYQLRLENCQTHFLLELREFQLRFSCGHSPWPLLLQVLVHARINACEAINDAGMQGEKFFDFAHFMEHARGVGKASEIREETAFFMFKAVVSNVLHERKPLLF